MKLSTSVILVALGVAFALPLGAADLSQLVASAAKYESGQSVAPVQAFEQLLRDSARNPALRADIEAAMIKLLAPGSTFEARRFACQQLAAVGSNASLPVLAGMLTRDETAGIACLALCAQRTPKAAEVLRKALPSARGGARLQIIGALATQRDGQSVKPLEALAHDADPELARAATLALGKIGGVPAHDAVLALRKENKPALATAVTEATLRVAEQLAAAGDRQGATALYEEMLAPSRPANIRRGAFGALLEVDKDGGEKRILEALHGRDVLLKPVAIAAAGRLKSTGASDKFAAELSGLAPQEQVWLIEALAARADAPAVNAMRKAAGSSQAAVRSAAVAALGRLNDASSAPLLCSLVSRAANESEREEIATALGQLHGSGVDEAIFAEVKRAGGEAKRELISLAGRRGNHASVPVLLEAAGSDDPATAKSAFQALGKVATAADLPAMLDRLGNLKTVDARSEAETAAGRVMQKMPEASQRSGAVLAKLAASSTVEARCSLLQLLPRAGDEKALAAVKAAGADAAPAIRETAVRVLAAWPDDAAWDALMALCQKPESATHRALAFRGLVRLAGEQNAKPDAALIERYRQLLSLAGNPGESKLVLGSLAGVASPDALPLAVDQLAKAEVRAEAAQAVTKIATAIKAQHPQAAQEALKKLTPGK